MPTIVKARKDDSNDGVIRRFKKRVLIDKILPRLKLKEFYLKPALKRKEKRKELERRAYREKQIAASTQGGKKTARKVPVKRGGFRQ